MRYNAEEQISDKIQELKRLRKKRRRRQAFLTFFILLLLSVAMVGGVCFIGSYAHEGNLGIEFTKETAMEYLDGLADLFKSGFRHVTGIELETETETETELMTEAPTEAMTEIQTEAPILDPLLVEKADALALTYDYDGAMAVFTGQDGYQANEQMQSKVAEYQALKDACVEIMPEDVTHIFYHSLVVDPSKAFVESDSGYAGWQQWMTTVYEFDQITQSMYDRGYVLVSIYDLFTKTTDEEGKVTISPKAVLLPEGKKAFVLSLDDLSYYHTYDNHGVAARIVLDEEGKPTCEYYEEDGTLVYGDYDVVPRMDTFLEEHPDGCYKGARGTIALTGYNGILGYRTDGTYSKEFNENVDVYYTDSLQQEWLDAHPDFDWKEEVAQATEIANALKAEGWTFANHTWGHKNIAETSYEDLVRDTNRWLKYVGSIVGETDAIIFAHGTDITSTGVYTDSDEKYTFLKSKGFDVYCNVDSVRYTTTVTDQYFHQGRRNLDGYRIYNDYITEEGEAITSDLFHASEVIDPDRPLPVPALE